MAGEAKRAGRVSLGMPSERITRFDVTPNQNKSGAVAIGTIGFEAYFDAVREPDLYLQAPRVPSVSRGTK